MYTQIKKENFKETIKKELMNRIKGVKLYENNVLKNNVTKLGIVVNRANENISPTFYIDDLYNMYLENNSIDEVVDFIENVVNENRPQTTIIDKLNNVYENVLPRLVNKQTNYQLLSDCPHRDFLDMAIVYYIEERDINNNGIMAIKVTNDMLQLKNLSEEKLYKHAIQNLKKKEQHKILGMSSQMIELMTNKKINENIDDIDFYNEIFVVLSNFVGVNGCRQILNNDLLKTISDKIKNDFYVLPSSIHEVLITPTDLVGTNESDIETLKQMVTDINEEKVGIEEQLTDNVYVYRYDKQCLEVA